MVVCTAPVAGLNALGPGTVDLGLEESPFPTAAMAVEGGGMNPLPAVQEGWTVTGIEARGPVVTEVMVGCV